jgi:glycosyltransferase involved in cell wall biosynthesis
VASLAEVGGDAVALVPVGDPHELACALRELFADDDRRAEMSARGLARVATRQWRDTALETVAVYRSLGLTV